ncbi:Uncharacterised protein [Algoriella xinjiangensis]|uniref:hypothetical protein n=1 Tax=Algoriella xinjiangensis TaxID=684065 RepID=UPI000F62DDDD|nr:hypothetical protein [Algoriella xinjiangensis]VDH15620.1 Uncharacterised protein [Algoriella xinjiangensis]
MSVKYNPNPTEYSYKKLEKITKQDYLIYKNSLPFYPKPISPIKAVWENETGFFIYLIFGCIVFPLLPIVIFAIAINGGFGSVINCYNSAQKRNIEVKKYFDLIYYTNSYDEYSQLFDKEFPNNQNYIIS